MQTNPEQIAPTQADRILVADILDEVSDLLDHNGIGQVADLIRDGEYDEHDCVKIAARHRTTTRTDAKPVAASPALMDLATASLIEARNALKQHWMDWDGEPEDGWALRLAWAKCGQTLSILAENSFDEVQPLPAPQPPAAERTASAEPVVRPKFPILGSRGQTVDFQLVADHGKQAQSNHYQTVQRLADRGGLSWCELHAVLHNRPWQKVDENTAICEVRALEARYLAASAPPSADVGELVEALRKAHDKLHECTAVLSANDCADVAACMAEVRALLVKHGGAA